MTVLYFDCFSGAAGDMILGSLIDAGVPLEEVRRALGSLAIGPGTVWTDRVVRAGVTATKFCVKGEDEEGHYQVAAAEVFERDGVTVCRRQLEAGRRLADDCRHGGSPRMAAEDVRLV